MIDVDRRDQRRPPGRRHAGRSAAGEAGSSRCPQLRGRLADVWDACTNAERIPRWFLPMTATCGRRPFQFEGNAGGTVDRCDPPDGFEATWE